MVLMNDLYQSRVEREVTILKRPDPVVYSGEAEQFEPVLSETQLAAYRRDGFLFLPSLFSAEEARIFREESGRLAQNRPLRLREEAILEPGGEALRSVFMVHRLNALYERLAADQRLVKAARQLLGSEVYLHQSRLNLKPGFSGKEFYWHSDFETWHIEDGMPQMRALSCSVLLHENNEFNGPLLLVPGSHMSYISCVGETPPEHYKASLRRQEYGVPDESSVRLMVERGGLCAIKGPPGSAVLFDCNALHASNSNISPYSRSNLFLVYNSVENRLGRPRSGQAPRPEYIAAREHVRAVTPLAPDYSRWV